MEGGSEQDDTHKQITLREGLRFPEAKAVFTAFFYYCALGATAGPWVSNYMVLHKGIAPQAAAEQASFSYLGITLDRLVSGSVTDQAGDRSMIRYGQLIAFVGTVLLFLPAGDRAILTGLIVVGLGCTPIYPSLFHETSDDLGTQYSQSMTDMQMVCACVDFTFISPLFRVVAGHISVTPYPIYLVVFVVLMIRMTERMGGVQDRKISGLTYAQLLQ